MRLGISVSVGRDSLCGGRGLGWCVRGVVVVVRGVGVGFVLSVRRISSFYRKESVD